MNDNQKMLPANEVSEEAAIKKENAKIVWKKSAEFL